MCIRDRDIIEKWAEISGEWWLDIPILILLSFLSSPDWFEYFSNTYYYYLNRACKSPTRERVNYYRKPRNNSPPTSTSKVASPSLSTQNPRITQTTSPQHRTQPPPLRVQIKSNQTAPHPQKNKYIKSNTVDILVAVNIKLYQERPLKAKVQSKPKIQH